MIALLVDPAESLPGIELPNDQLDVSQDEDLLLFASCFLSVQLVSHVQGECKLGATVVKSKGIWRLSVKVVSISAILP